MKITLYLNSNNQSRRTPPPQKELFKYKNFLFIVIVFSKIIFCNYFDRIMYFKDMNLQTFYKDRR